MADALFEGFRVGDYETFSRHFSDGLKRQRPPEQLAWERDQIISDCGPYRSRSVSHVSRSRPGYEKVTYRARFERDDRVAVIVAFRDEAGQRSIWFIRIHFPNRFGPESRALWSTREGAYCHFRNCWHLRDAAEADLIRYETLHEAMRAGRRACQLCSPY
jgi:hypothetical protein